MYKTFTIAIGLFLGCGLATLRADTQKFYAHGKMRQLALQDPLTVSDIFKSNSADLINGKTAKTLLINTMLTDAKADTKITESAVIHVVYWSKPDKDGNQTATQNWYVFRDEAVAPWSYEDFSSRNRIFGQKKILFLYVHLNKANSDTYEPTYDIEVKSKLPSNVLNLFSIGGMFTQLNASAAEKKNAAPDLLANLWSGVTLDSLYRTSDITFTPAIAGFEKAGTKTFDNEGKAIWDISFGVPLKKISQTSFDTTNNTISPATVDKRNLLALANIYLKPRDLKTSSFQWTPSFVAGVAFAQQPLHQILTAAGWGPAFAQFYIGVLWTKEASLTGPQPATASVKQTFSPKFAIGLNLPVRAIQQKLTGK